MKRISWLLSLTLVLSLTASAMAQQPNYQRRGTIVGGLLGAGAGAAIGDGHDRAGTGALIGAAVGAIGGAAVGNSMDNTVTRERVNAESQYYQGLNEGRTQQAIANGVTPQDVVAMTQAGLGDDVIATQVRSAGLARPVSMNDLIFMRRSGVSDYVIQSMQLATPAAAAAPARRYAPVAPAPATQVIVEERYYRPAPAVYVVPPPYYGPYHSHHHHHCPPPRPSGFSWGISGGF